MESKERREDNYRDKDSESVCDVQEEIHGKKLIESHDHEEIKKKKPLGKILSKDQRKKE